MAHYAGGFKTLTLLAILAVASPAFAYTQDRALEAGLARGDHRALALLPAKGYKDGVAGFFRENGLYVVPSSTRAWCTDARHGVLPPGCFIEFHFQMNGLRSNASDGSPCGVPGRWHRALKSAPYRPTPGAFYALAIASGDSRTITNAFETERQPVRLSDVRHDTDCYSKAPQ